MYRAAILLTLCACAQPPIQEIEMAAARLELARAAGAATYAAGTLTDAETALREAEGALSEPGSYREAVKAAARACLLADDARAQAGQETARMRRAASRLLQECRALIDESRSRGGRDPELEPFSARINPIQERIEAGQVAEGQEDALQLKSELLRFLEGLETEGSRLTGTDQGASTSPSSSR
jgi:hypothetical protein